MTMIAITTEGGRLHIFADIPLPNAEAGQWSPMRIKALARDIEAHVNGNELADLSARNTPPPAQSVNPWPPRKPHASSGLVIIDPLNDEGP